MDVSDFFFVLSSVAADAVGDSAANWFTTPLCKLRAARDSRRRRVEILALV